MSRPRGHGMTEGPFSDQVVPCHAHKVSCDVMDFLCGVDHIDLLFQKLSILFLGEAVLSHHQHDLYTHSLLLWIL